MGSRSANGRSNATVAIDAERLSVGFSVNDLGLNPDSPDLFQLSFHRPPRPSDFRGDCSVPVSFELP